MGTKTKAKRIRWGDRTLENDIKYGGFLSYRHLRIIGWMCLIIAQIGVVLKLEAKLAPETANAIEIWNLVISIISGLTIPLFLLANLSTILQKRGDFKSLFIKFGGMALGMYPYIQESFDEFWWDSYVASHYPISSEPSLEPDGYYDFEPQL